MTTNNFAHIGYADVTLAKAKTFSLNSKNREYNPNHLARIKREMSDCLMLMSPITVNTVTNNIVEGQHRHKAFIELIEEERLAKDSVLGVKFVSIPVEKELEIIIRANNNSKSWTLVNYVDSNIESDAYIKLNEWCLKHTLSCDKNGKAKVRYGSAIFKGKNCTKELKKGTFEITDEELQRAEQVHNELIQIIETLGKCPKGDYIEALAIKWIEVRDKHEFKTWLKELKNREYEKMKTSNRNDWRDIFARAHYNIDMKKSKK